jgi:competence protein ComEC
MTGRMGLDLRLVVPAAACWASAGVLVALPAAAAAAAGLLGTAALGLLVWAVLLGRPARTGQAVPGARPGRAPGTVAVCAAIAALAAMAVAVQAPSRMPDPVRTLVDGRGAVTATLTVWSAPVPSAGLAIGGTPQLRFRATLTGYHRADQGPEATADPAGTGLNVPVVVFAAATDGTPAIGDEIRLAGTLAPTDPGDAAAALFFGRGGPEPVRSAPWWLDWANSLRHGFAGAAGALPGEGGGLLPGLAIGDTTGVVTELDQAMKTSSLSHLTAVSGANCAIVLALVLATTSALGLGRTTRVASGLGVLAGFVVLVTPEPSVVRAAAMATIVLLSSSVGRPGRGVASLALASICLLVADPWLSRNYGFALSVLATLGLLVLAGPLTRRLRRWLPTPLAAVLAIPLAAQLACQPVLVLLSPTLPAYGVPANLLAAPAAPVATIVGLAACLLLPWLPGPAMVLMWLAWLPATWIAAVAQTTTTLPGNTLPWLGGPVGVALTLACAAAVLVLLVVQRNGPRPAALGRVASGVLLCVTAGTTVGILVGTGLGRAVVFPATWQIAACDIGQGDAVLVRDGASVALVDVGPDPALLAECLTTLGIDRVDLLVLTHYDLDHIGGLAAVIGRVDTALVGRPENGQDAALHRRLAAGGADVRETARGDTGTLGALTWEVLWPIRGSPVMQTGNPGSVSMLFDGRGIRSLFLGDLDEEAQEALRAAGPIGPVDVVKVAHHGSGDQSAALYAELNAGVGVVSVGADNGYGHPTRSVLDILGAAGTAVARTDRDGMVVVAPGDVPPADGASAVRPTLLVWTEKVTGAG